MIVKRMEGRWMMTKETREAGWKPDAPEDQRPDPPPAPPKPMISQCPYCKNWLGVTHDPVAGYTIPTHTGRHIAGFCPESRVRLLDCYVPRTVNQLSARVMEAAEELTASLKEVPRAVILEAIAKLALASTLLEE